ncbi:MAG TPA: phenylalanine 4-monooxygenase, partial [Anaeromyxobacteraceae bacterium]|nr:phenylalanine 4-monooxygenase [Anaeromyxobacteraceae bacterium]
APDIVHESAGHAPILADPDYAAFLQRAGELGFRAIASAEDDAVYEAIRALSVAKEDPAATPAEVAEAEERLAAASAARRYVSEATRASRLYWWTAEYGLVGPLDAPRIYGAGLLSSIGESTHCFSREVERLPLDVRAAEVEYDITRMQPQLFVVRELSELSAVVDDLARTLSWRRGGDGGLAEARRARTVNHLVLADGTAISGRVAQTFEGPRPAAPGLATALCVLAGPTQLARPGKPAPPSELPAVVAFGGGARGPAEGSFCLAFETGLGLSGRIAGGVATELRASLGSRELPVPARALLAASRALPSVSGGPADPAAWDARFGAPPRDGAAEARARTHKAEALDARVGDLYREVRRMREGGATDRRRLLAIAREVEEDGGEWLLREEVRELMAGEAVAGRAVQS